MNKSIRLIILLLLLAVSFVSCGKKDEPEVKVPFKVVSTNPAYGAKNVPLNTVIKFVFSKKIVFDPKCFNNGGTGLSFSASYDNDKTVSITAELSKYPNYPDVWIAIDGLKSVDGELLDVKDTPYYVGNANYVPVLGDTYWLTFGISK